MSRLHKRQCIYTMAQAVWSCSPTVKLTLVVEKGIEIIYRSDRFEINLLHDVVGLLAGLLQ